jgi:protoheme IX farnesyltransferase
MFYMIAASVLGLILLFQAVMLMRSGTNAHAWRMYKYSSYYLALLFAAMVVDQFIY